MTTYIARACAPDAPSPSGARALLDDDVEQRLRAHAGAALAHHDQELLVWAIDEVMGKDVLGRYWRPKRALSAGASARIAAWCATAPCDDFWPLDLLYIGSLLARVADNPTVIRAACADRASELARGLCVTWAHEHGGIVPVDVAGEVLDGTALPARWRMPMDVADALARNGGTRVRRTADILPALIDHARTVAGLAERLRAGEYIVVDRHLLGDDWCADQMAAMHAAVQDAAGEGAAAHQVIIRLARLAELIDDPAYALRLMDADAQGRAAAGALLVSYLDHPNPGENIYAFMCAVEEIGLAGALAEEYGSRLRGAVTRDQVAGECRSARLGLAPAGIGTWAQMARALMAADDEELEAIWPPARSYLMRAPEHVIAMCGIEHLPAFRQWQDDDDAFIGFSLHAEPGRTSLDRVRPCVIATVGAEIDGRFRSASAVMALEPPSDILRRAREGAMDVRALLAECLAAARINLDVTHLPVCDVPSIVDEWTVARPTRVVARPTIESLLGIPTCGHARGEWRDNDPGSGRWTPEVIAPDARVFWCDQCGMPARTVVPLHQVAGVQVKAAYLRRENFYRLMRGEHPAAHCAQLDEGRMILTSFGIAPTGDDRLAGSATALVDALFG